ncbi:pyridoxamine 5'-phosphate oxidase family protein [Noviherbaspirillum sp.]|uniref:pyridoxamine 5'-phosphate oxidase family protein n=1 Tax=Noviherbaspirillum sp. TaxID=1926288 RepID=UPI002D413DC3|nr:pyridoxamine 5'-phosphate oxidase family protein [Noviherbaspirillum sp.]HZW22160.1 pyridoxamine 5'-phosphate oxidase family protein [Noviherbaspirillum sp.]
MDVQEQAFGELKQVADLVDEIKFAMLTTEEPDGTLRSRPMATMQMDAAGCLWFFTAFSSPKVEETEQHHQVNLSYARTDKQDYLSISGTCEVVRDKDKMRALWSPWIKPWFPQGLDDPDLVLLKVTVTEAEYWLAPGSAAVRLYGLAKGMLTGNTDALGEHRKIVM